MKTSNDFLTSTRSSIQKSTFLLCRNIGIARKEVCFRIVKIIDLGPKLRTVRICFANY